MAYTISSLKRISPRALAERMLLERDLAEPTFAVIDVRDSDYIGGHIKGSTNIPSITIDAMLPTLVRKLQGKKMVVFHCALSQQRGPSAALKYLRQRDSLLAKAASATGQTSREDQDVMLLDQGFVGWQREFGGDKDLTEGYVKDLWENY